MFSKILFIAFLTLINNCNIQAQSKTVSFDQVNEINRPKLVIGLVVDQMRWDYLYRYYNRYSKGGFKRLMHQGYNFQNTFIPYVPAVTAAGHTCIYTGSVPAVHGMVGNDWVENNTGKIMYCAQDDSVKSVGSISLEGKMSPKNMQVTTVADELRLATNFRSRTFGIALKDRGGIFPAGHSGNAAYWFEDASGNWITSTYYMQALPKWVSDFNNNRLTDKYMQNDWNLLYPASTYIQSTADNKMYEKTLPHETTRTFPHTYKSLIGKSYYTFRINPFGNTLTLDFATSLIKSESLGKTADTDMLCISLSSTDYIGHRYGPNSMEIEDTYLRLDKDIEKFLNTLDAQVGKGNYLLFLTADHGAPNNPAFMQENKLPGGNLNAKSMIPDMNQMLKKQFGRDSLVKKIYEYQVYLNNALIDSLKLNRAAIKTTLVQFLLSKPEVQQAFDYSEFDKVIMPARIKEMFAKGYFRNRSGEVQFILKPQYHDVDWAGTEHGTWYPYDTHIPLIFFGWNINPGKTYREVYMTDIAPTLSALLNIQQPGGCIGTVLTEVVR
ncbi:MAG: alkaline phosphatase PafA [Ferruginibacter sp.]